MAGQLLIVDFRHFQDDHAFPASFAHGGRRFDAVAAGSRLFVNDTAGDRRLQFESTGVRVSLPHPVDSAVVLAGGFSGPVKVRTLNAHGAVQSMDVLLPANALVRQVIAGAAIVSIDLTEGGDGGLLLELIVPRCP